MGKLNSTKIAGNPRRSGIDLAAEIKFAAEIAGICQGKLIFTINDGSDHMAHNLSINNTS